MWPFLTDPPSFVQFIMLVGCVVMGLSHIVQPQLWVDFFAKLQGEGTPGLVSKIMMVELWPALFIVGLHQVWWGPGIVLTLYGWAQMTKVVIALLLPQVGMRSMAMAQGGTRRFVVAGYALAAVGLSAGVALFGPW